MNWYDKIFNCGDLRVIGGVSLITAAIWYYNNFYHVENPDDNDNENDENEDKSKLDSFSTREELQKLYEHLELVEEELEKLRIEKLRIENNKQTSEYQEDEYLKYF